MQKLKMDVVMALALNAVLVLLLLPMLYCSTADVATGDDLLNGAVVYHVLQDGGSMVDVLRAVGAYMRFFEITDIAVFGIERGIFGKGVFFLFPKGLWMRETKVSVYQFL